MYKSLTNFTNKTFSIMSTLEVKYIIPKMSNNLETRYGHDLCNEH